MSGDTRYGGSIYLKGELFLSDRQNSIGDEVWGFTTGQVQTDVSQLNASRMTCQINEIREYVPYQTMFAPFLTVKWLDPQTRNYVTMREQLGLYTMLPTVRVYDGGSTIQTIDAYDMTWLLSQRYTANAITLAAGTNPVTYIRTKLVALGFPRHRIASTSATLSKEYTWRAGTPWISVINDLLAAIAYYPIWADRVGILTSFKLRSLIDVEPQFRFSSLQGDIGKKITLETDQDRIKNDVMVFANSPGNDPIFARATNKDPNSATSIVTLRTDPNDDNVYLTLVIDNAAVDSQSAANALALATLVEHSSYVERMSIEIVPYPGIDIQEPLYHYIQTESGHVAADGLWWWDQMSVSFGQDRGAMTLRCNKLAPFEATTT